MSNLKNKNVRPSKLKTLCRCPAALTEISKSDIPLPTVKAQIDGKRQHFFCELVLNGINDPLDYLGEKFIDADGVWYADEELIEKCNFFIEYVRGKVAELPGAKLYVEVLEFYHAGPFLFEGTPDIVIHSDVGVWVIDRKLEWGAPVFPEESEQLIVYASTFQHTNLPIFLEIVQGTNVRSAKFSSEIINLLHRNLVSAPLKFAWEVLCSNDKLKDLPYRPGIEQCRYCPALGYCPGVSQHIKALCGAPTGGVGESLASLPLVKRWVAGVEDRARSYMTAGHPVEGYEWRKTRSGARAWIDRVAAEEILKSMISDEILYSKELRSATQILKAVKNKKLDNVKEEVLNLTYIKDDTFGICKIGGDSPTIDMLIDELKADLN